MMVQVQPRAEGDTKLHSEWNYNLEITPLVLPTVYIIYSLLALANSSN